MTKLLLLALLAACGSTSSTPVANAGSGAAEPSGPATDTRTEIERRRDTACEALGPRITECAVADAKRDLAAGKVSQEQFDKDTSADIQHALTSKYIENCEQSEYSSRQIRVLEVCQREESECEPLLACLDNLKPQ